MPKVNTFIARSFDPSAEGKIRPIINLLESFKPVGLVSRNQPKWNSFTKRCTT